MAEVQYKARGFWNKDCERAIVWNDPTIAIHWPLERLEALVSLSDKDADAIGFAEAQASGDVFPRENSAGQALRDNSVRHCGRQHRPMPRSSPPVVRAAVDWRPWISVTPMPAGWRSRPIVRTILNAGAYTAVDKAESEPELAHAVNAMAPRAFAEALKTTGGRLLQISTDFVFNGSQGTPYRPEQNRTPLGVYGTSKAAGEDADSGGVLR